MQLLFGTGSAPVFPGEVIFVDGFTVAAGASLLLVDDPFHAANILLTRQFFQDSVTGPVRLVDVRLRLNSEWEHRTIRENIESG